MAELTVPQIDFSSLGQLPQIYKQAQADQLRQQTLANLGQGGTVDAATLLKSGDLSLAQLGINVQNHQDTLKQQEIANARQSAQDAFNQKHQTVMEGIALRSANRADEGVPEKAADRAKAAAQYGLTPEMPEFKRFVLTGSLPGAGETDQVNQRISVLKANGVDPSSPEGKTYALTGTFTDPNLPKVLSPGSSVVRPGSGEVIMKNGGGENANLDDATITAMAEQARAGDTSVFQNLGRGAQGAENIVKLRKEIVRQNTDGGITGAEQALRNAEMGGVRAGQRTIGTKGANIEMAATEFNQVLPVVQEASKAVPRTNYPDLNKIIMAGNAKTGDPNVVKFGGGVNTLINLYARAISPTGTPTVSDKDHAREILAASWSTGQFDAAVGMMQQEIKAALSSPEKVRDEMRSRFLKGQGAAPVGYPAPGPPVSQGQGADAMLTHAREAIAAGAPRAAVLQRLQQAGIDPGGL